MDLSVTTLISKCSTTNELCFKGPYLLQNWSLPDSIIYYLAKNPKSPKCYQRLIQTCKYFFFKNPIIMCSDLNFIGRLNDSQIKIKIQLNGETKDIDLKKFSQIFWITDKIFIYTADTQKRNVVSSLIPNIYQCDIKYLHLSNQIVSLNELLFLASKADEIHFRECILNNENGSVVPVEKIIEAFVQVKTFKIDFNENDSSISSKTAENLLKISHLSNINKIYFNWISEIFDIETFFTYMKKNKHTYYELRFVNSVPDAYENRLSEIVDEILATENRDYKPPFIYFNGLAFEQFDNLRRLTSAYRNK